MAKGRVIGVNEFQSPEEAYRVMMAVEAYRIRKEATVLANVKVPRNVALAEILEVHKHPALRVLVNQILREVYSHGSQ